MGSVRSSLEALEKPEVDLAVKLAGFLRPSVLYPGSYPRVQAALVELLECSRGAMVKFGEVRIRFEEQKVEILGVTYLADHPDLVWMAGFFREAVLEGAVLERGGSYQGFLSFSERLVESRKLASEGAWRVRFWEEPLPGIRPLPLCDPEPVLAGLARTVNQAPFPSRTESEPESPPEAGVGEQADLLGILSSCDGIQERIQEAAALLPGLPEPATFLEDLLHLLPEAAGQSPATVIGMVDQVLERVLPVLGSLQPVSWEADHDLIQAAFGRVASRLFAQSPSRSTVPHQAQPGVPRSSAALPTATSVDAPESAGAFSLQVEDEVLEALAAQWNALPDEAPVDLQAGARADALVARLESILEASDEARARREAAILGRTLTVPDAEELEVWRAFLGTALTNHGRPGAHAGEERLLALIRQMGRADLAKRAGLLDLADLRQGFPWLFPLFVEALDPEDQGQVLTFQRFCAELGPRRILAESRFLASSVGILPARCGNRILSMPGRPLVPFVLILLRFRGEMYHKGAARFLARAGLDFPEAQPFWFYDKPEALPLDFLRRICEAELAGKASRELSSAAASLLQRFVEESADDPDLIHPRVEAVRALGAFPFPETERFLIDLRRGTGLIGFRRQPAELREACREALETLNQARKQA